MHINLHEHVLFIRLSADNDDKVVMTGGSFKSDEPVTFQPRVSRSENKSRPSVARAPFDDTLSERNWSAPLCECKGRHNNGSCKYSRTSEARTLMARLPRLFRTHS